MEENIEQPPNEEENRPPEETPQATGSKERKHVTIPRFYRSNKLFEQYKIDPQDSQIICPKPQQNFCNDSLNTEFLYYMGAIKELLPALSIYGDQIKVLPWLKKLFSPQYQVSRLRLKRNKYLLHLILIMINDKIFGIFQEQPPPGKLLEVSQLRHPLNAPLARWEKDMYWEELLKGMQQDDGEMKCSRHDICGENEEEGGAIHPIAGALLDQEFKFFLYLARPYVILIPEVKERSICAVWILTLAKVTTCSCLTMKAIRNDYMQALMGYLLELRLVFPFNSIPPENGTTLKPLAEVAEKRGKFASMTTSVTNPASEEAEYFMQQQPIPESGAFCYIAITGNACEPKRVSNVPLTSRKYDSYFET